jgi:hypothetical protein
LTPSPILKVLSTIRRNGVRSLLMGGQACVLYGGAEFSRDTDILVVADPANLARLQAAVDELQADVIAVPPFEGRFLDAGHAVHFRCRNPEAAGLRLDVMAKLRGLPDFKTLWDRRTTVETPAVAVDLLSLPDLVTAKKTQRDKDWPMIRRLLEANYFANRAAPSPEQLTFWFQELRTPELLRDLASAYPALAEEETASRSLIRHAISGDFDLLTSAMEDEERQERLQDQAYWLPLKRDLERLRRQ